MKDKLVFFLKYFIYWIVILLFFKLVFILYHINKFNDVPLFGFLSIFTHGFKLDLSLTGYILLLPAFIMIILTWIKNEIISNIFKFYTIVLIPVICLLYIIDLELYNYWRFRLDETFLDYINTPEEMLANLNFIHYVILFLLLGALFYLLIMVFYKRFLSRPKLVVQYSDWRSSLVFIFTLPILFIMIRGGVSTSTINTGSVYFHKDIMVNHAAINPIWNLLYTVTESEKLKYSVKFFNEQEEEKLLQKLKSPIPDSDKILNTDNPNIIIIILESFGYSVIKELSGREGITPDISKLIPEGIFFNNFYATGSSSNRGIGAIISNYPSLPKTCVLHYENKTEKLPGISKDLKKKGYTNRFFYGGDIDFAHIRSFLINNQFDEIVSFKDFPRSDYYSKWGVPDHIVFERLLEQCNASNEPFFHALFTLSSHEPFDVPMETVIEGKTREALYFNSIYYTDQSLGKFIDLAKEQSWWDSTLIILVADHGARIEDITHFDRRRYNIPMLWLGGALNIKDTTINTYGSQTDIAATLMHQMGYDTDRYYFSKDLFSKNVPSYAYYTFPNGIGFVTDTSYLVYDLTSNQFLVRDGLWDTESEDITKAQIQSLLKNFQRL